VNTDNALGGNSIVLGDEDTGFKQSGDGVLDVYANYAHVFRFINGNNESLRSLVVHGNCHTTGEVLSGNGAAKIATDGNIYGPVWGGWLINYLHNNIGVQDVRLGGQGYHTPGSNVISWSFGAPSGHVLTGINISETGSNSADNVNGVYYRPVQKLINGTWYNVASV
ncbi:phage tail protein, partial [Citrobacter braakii]|nr:phage tail protein [Citrobacter braakii]